MTNDKDKSLSTVFGVEDEIVDIKNGDIVNIDNSYKNDTPDFEKARMVIRNLLETGNTAVSEMSTLASMEESPRGFEVLGTLMKNVADIAKDLCDTHEKEKKFLGMSDNKSMGNINVSKAVFVGSPTDLLDSLKNDTDPTSRE